jgi:hypothetical protein
LDGNNAEYFDHLFEMTSVSTQPWERINCNEEERLRKGFVITTHFNFSKADGKEQKECAQIIDANGNPIFDIVYGSAAQLWSINRGWKKREWIYA